MHTICPVCDSDYLLQLGLQWTAWTKIRQFIYDCD